MSLGALSRSGDQLQIPANIVAALAEFNWQIVRTLDCKEPRNKLVEEIEHFLRLRGIKLVPRLKIKG